MTLRDKTTVVNVTPLKTVVVFENVETRDTALSVAINSSDIDCQTFLKEDLDPASTFENIGAEGWPKLYVNGSLAATGSVAIKAHLGIK